MSPGPGCDDRRPATAMRLAAALALMAAVLWAARHGSPAPPGGAPPAPEGGAAAGNSTSAVSRVSDWYALPPAPAPARRPVPRPPLSETNPPGEGLLL